MKKILLALLLAIALCGSVMASDTQLIVQADVSVSTTPTLVKGITNGRKWSLDVNTGSYEVRLSTKPTVSSTTGIPLAPNYGSYEDNYFVASSSIWAVCVSTMGSTVSHTEKY